MKISTSVGLTLVLLFIGHSAFAQAVKNVNVINTTPIPVVAVDDHVSFRVSGEFLDNSCCLTDVNTGFVSRIVLSQFADRDLLIEYVSCQVLVPPTQQVNLYIGDGGQNAPVDTLIAIELSEQYSALASDSLFGVAFHASHAVKVIVPSGSHLLLIGRRSMESGLGRASCVVAGRWVN